jgi:AraC-like DNA-binding protein
VCPITDAWRNVETATRSSREKSEEFTAARLLQKGAELALGIEPHEVGSRPMDTPLFRGRLMAHEVQPGLFATASELIYFPGARVTVDIDAGLLCGVLLEGSAESMRIGSHGLVCKCLGRPVLVGIGARTTCERHITREHFARDAGFMIKPAFFDRFGPQVTDDGLAALQSFLMEDFRSTTLQHSPRVLDIARRNLDHPYNGQLAELFLESNTLAYVLEVASLLKEEQQQLAQLGRRHFDQVASARQILDERIASPPSTLELARLVGVNITTLQSNFKRAFKTTIFGYVRSRRLMVARVLLREHGLPPGEVGRRVGFASAAAFSTAFKQSFGHPPSAERESRAASHDLRPGIR